MKLKKITIANLNPDEMENINGGSFIAGCDVSNSDCHTCFTEIPTLCIQCPI